MGSHKYIPGFCRRHLNKSNHTRRSGFPRTSPRCAGTVTPSLLSPPLLFQRSFSQDPGPGQREFLSLCWRSSAERPAAPSQPELGAWRGFCCCSRRVRGPLQSQESPEHRVWTFSRREARAQPSGDAGLQAGGLPVPPAPPPTWSSSGAAVRDSRVTILLSRQKACLG